MKQNRNLKLFFFVIIVAFGMLKVPQTMAMSDKIIKQRIEDEAADIFRLRGTKVNVVVTDGYVFLYGAVGLYIQKMLFEQIALKTRGVVVVDNEIRVVPRLPQSDADIERRIMELVQNHLTLQGVVYKVTVEGGAVLVHATFEHPGDVQLFKHRLAEIEGVISIKIQVKFIS